jgi:hypothetical protein
LPRPTFSDGTCCVDLCPPEFAFASQIVDVGLIYAALAILAYGCVFVGGLFSLGRNKRYQSLLVMREPATQTRALDFNMAGAAVF